jgi:hypothetical protein
MLSVSRDREGIPGRGSRFVEAFSEDLNPYRRESMDGFRFEFGFLVCRSLFGGGPDFGLHVLGGGEQSPGA